MFRRLVVPAAVVVAALVQPSSNLSAAGRVDPARLPFPLQQPSGVPSAPKAGLTAPNSFGGATTGAAKLPGSSSLLHKKPRGIPSAPAAHAGRLEDLSMMFRRFQALQGGAGGRQSLRIELSPAAARQVDAMAAGNGSSFVIGWRPELGTPRFIAGRDLLPEAARRPAGDAAGTALEFLVARRTVLGVENPAGEFRPTSVETDRRGYRAVRFQQTFGGLDIWGHDLVVRLDPDDRVIGLSAFSRPTPDGTPTSAAIDANQAARAAVQALNQRDGVNSRASASQLLLYPTAAGLRPAWKVTVEDGLAWRMDAFVDAGSGEFLHAISLVHTDGVATGSGLDLSNQVRTLGLYQVGSSFFMIDTRKDMFLPGGSTFPDNPRGGIIVINAQNGQGNQLFHVTSSNANSWPSFRNAVSATSFAGQVYDYYRTRHDRSSIDGSGGSMWLVVNFDQNYDNAFWNGQMMVFGNGNGSNFSDLAGALDVTAHEMSHGIIEKTAGLVYEFQSGALNEHFADAFGAATEFFVKGNQANWLMGEEVTTPSIPNDALRNMENPAAGNVAFGGQQPAHMDQFQNLPSSEDHGGVHINSGIPNRAFFLAATAMGIEEAEQVWYKALTQYLVRNSAFIDFRLATIQAATDIFGNPSSERQAVIDAMDAVGITDGEPTGETPPLPDNPGADFIAVMDAGNGHILRVDPGFATTPLDISAMAIGAGGRPSFSDDGSIFAWVGADGNVYAAFSDGSGAGALSEDGGWWSVAMSPDKQYLAATTVQEDGRIYVLDLESGALGFYDLGSQNSTNGSVPDVVAFADVLEFTADGQFLVYDALNRAQLGETDYEYWDINMIRLSDAVTFRVFPPLPVGESVGNPTFGQNHESRLAFDYASSDGNIYVLGVDLQTGAQGVITNNFASAGRPTFSGDDTQVYYQFRDDENDLIFKVTLDESGVAGEGDDVVWAQGGVAPVWFTVGTRPTPVTLAGLQASWSGEVISLDWQVTDAVQVAGFHVQRAASSDGPWERRTESLVAEENGRGHFVDAAPAGWTEAWYRIDAVLRNGDYLELGTIPVRPAAPVSRPVLGPPSPNPFTSATRFEFSLPENAGAVSVSVHDVSGRLVARVLDGARLPAGTHSVQWAARRDTGETLAPGTYFVRLETASGVFTRKAVLIH